MSVEGLGRKVEVAPGRASLYQRKSNNVETNLKKKHRKEKQQQHHF